MTRLLIGLSYPEHLNYGADTVAGYIASHLENEHALARRILTRHSTSIRDCLTTCSLNQDGPGGALIMAIHTETQAQELRELGGQLVHVHDHRDRAALQVQPADYWMDAHLPYTRLYAMADALVARLRGFPGHPSLQVSH